MTAPEKFVSRWARLKRDAKSSIATEESTKTPPLSTSDVAAGSAEAPLSQPRDDATTEQRFDLAGLPSIDAITANTDISGFLQSRVPAALTRAALRQAWASDPAIRDFIGIAENQWDFNDPNAIPGFGPSQAQDSVPGLLARALEGYDNLAEMIPEVEQPLPPAIDPRPTDVTQSASATSDVFTSANGSGIREDGSGEDSAVGNDRETGRNRRSHGSALPR
ncbi:DUF3306 domain-containing protein [Bradyrhizobium sp.]|uniref:DUF3306 domain-containing protein n=1 Tax=Bradyrhizobium sp. TaxID=376 RepID=UPI003C6A9F6F